MASRIEAFAAEMEVPLRAPEHAPCTVAPLAAAEYARDQGRLEAMRDRLMDAYWVGGRDIESPEVIGHCAGDAGLDPAAAAAAAVDPVYLAKVTRARELAMADNVTAIPTLLIGGFPIVGCQRWELIEMIAERRGLPRR